MTSLALHLVALVQEEHAVGPASPFEVNFGLFFWTWVVFVGLFFALKRFAWPAILRATEERERKIRAQIEDAERMNAEARAALEEHKKLLAGAKGEAHALLNEAKAVAQKEREALLAKARQEQEQILERARREIAAERERAVRELRREAVDLSLAAAAKLIERRLDDEANRRLVSEFLESVGKGR
ncbi:MAG TPA: F0F1 ATP synthase subunit B [Gemmatimonadales bacterium]|nr:F0F1 ATP synthase subunit B [Gemmatimonadales bacterium]